MFKPGSWQSHGEYRTSVTTVGRRLSRNNPKYSFNEYDEERQKLLNLNLDPLLEYIPGFYSKGGRQAARQAQILRSLILFVLLFNKTKARTSLTLWVRKVLPKSISLAVLIGCASLEELPPLGSYYDFMNRFWIGSRNRYSRTALLPAGKNGKNPKTLIGADGKLAEPEDPCTVTARDIVNDILDGKPAADNPEAALQKIFSMPAGITFDKSGHPIYPAGHEMCPWGNDPIKDAHKYRCPLRCGRIRSCTNEAACSPGSYGRTVYVKNHADLRFHPRIPRDSEAYRQIYSERTACERINDRGLNDYCLQNLKIRGRDHFSFWSMLIGICIHPDARYKAARLYAA